MWGLTVRFFQLCCMLVIFHNKMLGKQSYHISFNQVLLSLQIHGLLQLDITVKGLEI